jgi:hypothetical protein
MVRSAHWTSARQKSRLGGAAHRAVIWYDDDFRDICAVGDDPTGYIFT